MFDISLFYLRLRHPPPPPLHLPRRRNAPIDHDRPGRRLAAANATLPDTVLSFFVPSRAGHQIAIEIWQANRVSRTNANDSHRPSTHRTPQTRAA